MAFTSSSMIPHTLFTCDLQERPTYRIHLIGIGGTGLAPIANVLIEMGYQVSGSDQTSSTRTAFIRDQGGIVHIGHDPRHLLSDREPTYPDLVLISSAVPHENPEIQAAADMGIPIVRRADILGPLTAGHHVIAVAGTHGKTTTTAMIAHILGRAGFDPGYLIGSDVPGLGISSAGQGDCFVIEADEYDHAFWGLQPTIIVLTSLDWDHPDFFPTQSAYEEAFRVFLERLQPDGHVVYCADDQVLARLAAELSNTGSWHGYGSRSTAAWRATHIDIAADATTYILSSPDGSEQRVQLMIPGLHNVLNSAGAIISAELGGVTIPLSAEFLRDFSGASRRFERKGELGGILVIDDYAHHPAEIRSTLAAARAAYPERDIWAVYQPHTYSRTRTFLGDFEGVFAAADQVIITDIYPAREPVDPGITSQQVAVASRHLNARHISTLAAVEQTLLEDCKPPALVLILSAGSATQLADSLLLKLAERS